MKRIHYHFRKDAHLIRQGEYFYLLSEIPLILLKINDVFYHLLVEMKKNHTLSLTPEKDREMIDLLERLVTKGFLKKEELFETDYLPYVSIIIPVKNRPKDIEECIISLISLDYPKERLEIIVVDDGSTDSTREVIESFPIKAIHLSKSIGASACRNLAAKVAKGELLAFTDSDCVAHPNWLKDIAPYFEEKEIGIVGGYVSNFYNHSPLDRYEDVKSPLNIGSHSFRIRDNQSSNRYVPSCNLIIRKNAFFEVGGFQEDLIIGEDVDLCWRTKKLGYQLLYVPQGEVKHKHRNDLPHMLARRYDYGTSEAILYLRHKDKRKVLYIPAWYSVFYGSICLGIIIQFPLIFVFGLGIFLIDFFRKHAKIKKNDLGLSSSKVFFAVLRNYLSFSYHTSSHLVRYYLIFLIPFSFFYPKLWGFLLSLLIFSASVDFSVKGPKINFFSFLFFYTLDQLAYQSGVLLGCIKGKTLMPYVPSILRKRCPFGKLA